MAPAGRRLAAVAEQGGFGGGGGEDEDDAVQLLPRGGVPSSSSPAGPALHHATAATAAAGSRAPPFSAGGRFSPLSTHDTAAAAGRAGTSTGRWCPEDEAGWLSRLFFSYLGGLLAKGDRLELEELPDVSVHDEPHAVWGAFERHLAASARPGAPRGLLWRALVRMHARVAAQTAAVKVVHDLLMFSQPYLLELLLHHLSAGGHDRCAWFGRESGSSLPV